MLFTFIASISFVHEFKCACFVFYMYNMLLLCWVGCAGRSIARRHGAKVVGHMRRRRIYPLSASRRAKRFVCAWIVYIFAQHWWKLCEARRCGCRARFWRDNSVQDLYPNSCLRVGTCGARCIYIWCLPHHGRAITLSLSPFLSPLVWPVWSLDGWMTVNYTPNFRGIFFSGVEGRSDSMEHGSVPLGREKTYLCFICHTLNGNAHWICQNTNYNSNGNRSSTKISTN